MTKAHPAVIPTRLRAILEQLDGRAAGLWRREGDRLEQAAFVAAADLDPVVAERFEQATRSVPIAETDLGIVRAAITAEVVVSVENELPAEHGSGHWLRAFGASCSVAVPLMADPEGLVCGVASLALATPTSDHVTMAVSLLRTFERDIARGPDR